MAIMLMQSPDLGFRFAWDPEKRGVFCLDPAGKAHEQIAAGVTTPELAKFAADMWQKGYRSRAREITRKPGAKHYHMLAEGGASGVKGFPV